MVYESSCDALVSIGSLKYKLHYYALCYNNYYHCSERVQH